jgi:hypothetical protein
VHRDRVGVAAFIRNVGTQGIRDIELEIDLLTKGNPVLTLSDVLAFCPAAATCPWGTAFGITEDRQRSIETARVTITGVGPAFNEGKMHDVALTIAGGTLTFEQPPPRGVTILYVVRDEAPVFGMFRTHEMDGPETVRLTADLLPIGPGTRAVFYEGHVPEAMNAFGH